jgi:MFS family permease
MLPSSIENVRNTRKHGQIYYGWIMLPVVVAIHFACGPGQTIGISVFNPSIREALRLTHSQLSGAYMVATLLAGCAAVPAGMAMDRFGIRRAMSWTVFFMGLACFFMAHVHGLLSLFLAFFFLRVLGHGAMPLMAENTVAMWFNERLGVATGFKNLAHAGAVAAIPAGFMWLYESLGWRTSFMALGALVWITMFPLMLFVYRNKPAETEIQAVPGGNPEGSPADDLEFREAARSRAYWILLVLAGFHGLVWAGIAFHIVPLTTIRDVSATSAPTVFVVYAICLAAVQPIAGLMADRLPARFVLGGASILVAGSILVLVHGSSLASLLLFGGIFGVAQGVEVTAMSATFPRYFGRVHLGKIRGGAAAVTVMGSSLGPFLLGVIYDRTGTFETGLWIMIGAHLAISLVLPFATRPSAGVKYRSK